MNRLSFSLLLLVILINGSLAQKRDPCEGDTTADMRECAGKKYRQADDELNRVYRLLVSKLNDEGHKTSLKKAQQAWLRYRDTNCDFVSYRYRGGSIAPVIVSDCMTNTTLARAKELKDQIRWLENL